MTISQIIINVVAPVAMRYQTVGDWQVYEHTLGVTVADSGNALTNLFVGLHEAIEAVLFLDRGGSEEAVDKFDMQWKNSRAYDEAGDDPTAPYHREHVLATIIERMLVHAAHLTWELHAENVEAADRAVAKARKARKQ